MMKSAYSYTVCFCFRRRFRRAASNEAPEAIKGVFGRYSSEGGVMEPEELRRFMEEVQGDGAAAAAAATREAAQEVIEALKSEPKHLKLLHRKGLSVDGFYRYLVSDDNAALPPRPVYQDMDGPLSHYFIYTGHNSYLTGNQLNSECSDVPIIHALERGVRVIELDLWPNNTDDNVHVLHGGTLTPPVELERCLMSIKRHAFAISEYPVIITLEDHLTADLQQIVAEMLVDTFGDKLYTTSDQSAFPSPAELKKRILISTKPPMKYSETKVSTHEIKDKDPREKKEEEEKKRKRKKKKKKKQQQQQQGDDEEAWGGDAWRSDDEQVQREPSEQRGEEDDEEEDDGPDEKAHHVAATEYKHLIAIAAKKLIKGDLESSLKIDTHRATRLSLSESALEKAALSHGAELIRFTQRNLLRIYPRGSRVTSSNYKPLLGWNHGAQMVALNMQGHGKALWLAQGMFRANGGCGYVRKPDILLNDDPDHLFNPNEKYPVKTTLKVRVYAGDGWRYDYGKNEFDTYSPPDFYTRVGIAGVPADTAPMKRTRAIEDNWTPQWDEEFEFPLRVPELALLRIEVYEYDMSDKDDFAGQTCLPVWELRTGIRSVRLCNHRGETMHNVKLLMRFQFV